MDDPVADISQVIFRLTKGSPYTQQATLEQYFVPKASFFHPFCSVHHNRDAVLRIFQWYKIMSPHIDISVNSIAYDDQNLTLYVNMSQVFRIFIIPFYRAPVTLTTVLQLEYGEHLNLASSSSSYTTNSTATGLGHPKYYIKSQNDLYQVDQFIRFALPWGIGTTFVLIWHWIATLCCILGARLCAPLRWSHQAIADARPTWPDVPASSAATSIDLNGDVDGDAKEHESLSEWTARLRQVAAHERELVDLQRGQF